MSRESGAFSIIVYSTFMQLESLEERGQEKVFEIMAENFPD